MTSPSQDSYVKEYTVGRIIHVHPHSFVGLQVNARKVETLSKKVSISYKSEGEAQIKSMQCATDPPPLPLLKLMTIALNNILDLVQL